MTLASSRAATNGRSQTVYTGITARTCRFGRLIEPDRRKARCGRVLPYDPEVTTTSPHSRSRLLLALLSLGLSLGLSVGLAAGLALAVAPAAGAATSASLEAKSGCDLQVINDWADNGVVDGLYAIPCYTQAIQRLNSYPDIKGYSSAPDDIHDALLAAIRQDRGSGGSGPGATPSGPDTGGPSSGPTGTSKDPPKNGNRSVVDRIGNTIGPDNATSIPLPLLVLGGLALLLLLSAGGLWIARRVQARRGVTPAASRR